MLLNLALLISVFFFIQIVAGQEFSRAILQKAWYSPSECGKNLSRMTRRFEISCFQRLTANQLKTRNLEYEEMLNFSTNIGNDSWWRSADEPRIYGGNDTENGAFPWTARMYVRWSRWKEEVCTGGVINEIFIITAAHCVHNKTIDQQDRRRMRWFVSVDPPIVGQMNEIKIVDFWTHPCFMWPDYRHNQTKPENCTHRHIFYDVGLVLIENLTATNDGRWPLHDHEAENSYYKFNSICHTRNEWPVDMTEVYQIAGWGKVKEQNSTDEVIATRLQWFRIVIRDIYDNSDGLSISFYQKPGYAICGGDSGSPILSQMSDGTFFQRGLLSASNDGRFHDCARSFFVAVNINYPEVRDWIWGLIERYIPGRS